MTVHWKKPDDPRRCSATEFRLVKFKHSVVRTLVQCGLMRDHEGEEHKAQGVVFGKKTIP